MTRPLLSWGLQGQQQRPHVHPSKHNTTSTIDSTAVYVESCCPVWPAAVPLLRPWPWTATSSGLSLLAAGNPGHPCGRMGDIPPPPRACQLHSFLLMFGPSPAPQQGFPCALITGLTVTRLSEPREALNPWYPLKSPGEGENLLAPESHPQRLL